MQPSTLKPLVRDGISIHGLLRQLRAPSLGLAIFLLGIHSVYWLPLILPTGLREEKSATTRLAYAIAAAATTAGGLLESVQIGMWTFRRKTAWALISVSAISAMLGRAVYDSEASYRILQIGYVFLSLLFLPAIGARRVNWPWLWSSLLLHTLIGIPATLYLFFARGLASREALMTADDAGFLAVALYGAVALFMLLPIIRSRVLTSIAVSAFCTGLLGSLFSYQRSCLFLIPLQLLLLLYVARRTCGVEFTYAQTIRTGLACLLFLASLAALLVLSPYGDSMASTVTSAIHGQRRRMLEKGDVVSTVVQNERWHEAACVMESMAFSDWVYGKGLAARWSSSNFLVGEERAMVHNTWLNCFYWGGVALFLTVAWPAVWAFRVLRRSRDPIGICCSAYVVYFYATFPFFLATYPTMQWVLFCVTIGGCIGGEIDVGNVRIDNSSTPSPNGKRNHTERVAPCRLRDATRDDRVGANQRCRS